MTAAGCFTNSRERAPVWIRDAAERSVDHLRNVTCPKFNDVVEAVAGGFHISVSNITGKSFWWLDVSARQITMALAYRTTQLSFVSIGERLSVDHTSVLHASRKYDNIIIELCSKGGVTLYVQKNAAYRSARRANEELKLAKRLTQLAHWSILDAYSAVEDIFPHMNINKAAGLLRTLHCHGYAESEKEHGIIWWRITNAGRQKLTELDKHLQRAAPVNRTACSGRAGSAPGRLDQPYTGKAA